ncbi:MAG TPA: ImcF-related family protein [Candidatus Dormibacteraeota bacterium]|nr:ImcF-related family protein [Candidatus Dormibacteraeota bacterium]
MYWVTVVILVIYVVLVWLLGGWLPLHGKDVWILRGVLAVLGLIGAGVAFWYQYKMKKAREATGEEETPGGATDDLDALVRGAIRRLKQSTLGKGTDISSLPIVFLLGDSGSTKTTVLIHSALDPELLAGQVYRENDVMPTSAANLWYTRQAIFVDPAGAMMGQAERWKRLVKLLQPARFSAAIGKRAQAPRAAIVCFDCETFLQPGASEAAVSAARRLSVRLQEVSQLLGISFPVYVLFTRLDRVSFFTEFVRGMSKDEASEVLGATLPIRSLSSGVYADEETRRLAKAFDEIFYSLAERRIVLLPRENDGDKLPGIYEFPRELKKVRTLLVQFLVDLARPSQLNTNPFLRGFYFTGVRPIVVDDVVAAPVVAMEPEEASMNAGATQIFRPGGSPVAQAPAAVRGGGPRRMPQWVFLTSLFNDVLVKDRVALAASGSSSHVSLLRRMALGAALFLALVCLTGFAVSFFRNHALETRVHDAIEDLRTVQSSTDQRQPASIGDLQKLDRLRGELVDLSDWEENGAPWSMRWGLYTGHQVYEDAKPVYFDRFRHILFGETQKRVVDSLLALPDSPPANAPDDAYEKTYNELKAYLITTSYHDKSTKEFLTPVLMSHWVADRDIDKDRKDLAAAQFDFYATELAKENPFSSGNSPSMIVHTQNYLNGFAGIDRFYVQLLGKVPNSRDLSFNEAYPDSNGVILSSHKVKGAFTRAGFLFVQDALKNPSSMGGEEWVLGKPGAQSMDPIVLRQKLTARYNQDFVNEWNAVLKNSSVAPYSSFADADKKLQKLTDPASPQMELLYFISHNVDVAPPDVKAPFAPVQAVESPGPADKPPDKYIGKPTEDYVKALGTLNASIHGLAQSTGAPDPALLAAAGASEGAASSAVTTVITAGPVDSQFANEKQVRRLLQEPITAIDALLRVSPVAGANAGAKTFCTQFLAATGRKFPFDPNALQELPVDQLNAIFTDGFKKLTEDVKPFVLKVGNQYVANPTAAARPSPAFLQFLTSVSRLNETLYPSGSPPPHFSFTLKLLPSNLEGVELKIGDKKLAGTGTQETFVWTGAAENISVEKNGDTLDAANGPWAIFRFLSHAKHVSPNDLQWVIENNGRPVPLPNGKIKSYDYQLQAGGSANPFFDFPGMKCVPHVAGP